MATRIEQVQTPIIPLINQWSQQTPDVVSLGQGMVFYPPPESALTAIQTFGHQPEQHYYHSALGYAPLRAMIAEKLKTDNAIDSSHYALMVTAGANMAFFTALMAISSAGDEIILPTPYYFNQEMAIRLLDCQPVCVAVNADYQLNVSAIRSAITAKTRAIVTVSPNNPTGAVYSEASLREVNALCREYGLYHLCDEAYEYFVYGSARHFSPACIAGAEEYTISLYSLSKAYGFAGWRVGYVLFPKALLSAMLKVQDTNLICPPLINQYAAVGAMQAGANYCRRYLPQLLNNRAILLDYLSVLADVCELVVTDGAFYLLIKLCGQYDDLQLAKRLIDDFKVAVISGSAFGCEQNTYLRLSYGMLSSEQAHCAGQRLLAGLKQLTA